MPQSDKHDDSPMPDNLAQARHSARAEQPRRRSDDWPVDKNDTPPPQDVIVSDHAPDSDEDNDDEINNDVTSPEHPDTSNDRVSSDGMPLRPPR